MKLFRCLSEEERVKLFISWCDGTLQVYDKGLGIWLDSDPIRLYINRVYRIKAVPITLDWSQLNPKWKYVARDEDNSIYGFTHDASVQHHTWTAVGGCYCNLTNVLSSLKPGNTHWELSKIKRPTDEGN